MRKYIFSIFLLTIYLNSTETAKAGIFDDTLFRIKGIFGVQNNIGLTSGYSENQELVLKANYKTIKLAESTEANYKLSAKSIQNKNENKESEVVALSAEVGPMRVSTEEELIDSDNIQVYEVKNGDTLSSIAKIYNVSRNTIAWANEIKDGKVKAGDILIILPISGVKHTVKKGDTLKSITKKYGADTLEILDFNNLKEGDALAVGEDIIIPDGKLDFDAPTIIKKTEAKKRKIKIYASAGVEYFARPIIGGIRTQGIHGNNAVDIAAPVGTPLLASAAGTVLAAKNSGYNGGYGKIVIISHPNGTQSVYAHMNNIYVSSGQNVSQGEVIGEVGNSGKSTGPHVHFEIRGAQNPF